MEGGCNLTELTIRDAQRADVPTIVALLADDGLGSARESVDGPVPNSYYMAFDSIANTTLVRLLLAELDGEIIGCMQLNLIPHISMKGGTRAQLQSMRIRSDRRGQGLGGIFVRQAMDLARNAGCVQMELTTHNSRSDAHLFYKRLGFQATHQGMKIRLDQ